ncbi:hypothetical protein SRABI83_04094 [Arthrobacter sp. Bi83]|uniref:hypothetical protein n=1 Tax=Arthrobacter sp. Bi83 TaxID=2822353 RepID=UPI001D977FB7|nr:hypothetical protein [Arthrobacter sp. Bi83]CAH0287046.1 hypothetical protein SRABI83_04094 [Arthrobacter sp. Bi83]
MKSLLGGALLLCLLSVTACGSSAPAAAPNTTPVETATPTPTATVSQFASVIAEHEKSWRDYEEKIVDCAFAGISSAAIDQVKRTTCTYTASTVTLEAQTALRDIMKLPSPPAEIKDLVNRTITVLEPLGDNQASTACSDQTSEACDGAITKANGDIRPVTSVLDAWKPYL